MPYQRAVAVMKFVCAFAALRGAGFTCGTFAAEQQPDYTSKVPQYTFADTLPEQEAQLKTNPLLRAPPRRPKYSSTRTSRSGSACSSTEA